MREAKMVIATMVCASLLCSSVGASSQGNTFDRVRYNGGTIANPVDPKDWNNHLTVASDAIVFTFKNGENVTIAPKSVTSLSYGQEAHRRVGTMIALAILVSPVALFGLLHKTRLHFIGVQFKTSDGKSAGLLLQGDKDNYRAILVALQSVSGVPVTVAEKDREFVPVGVRTDVAKNSEPAQPVDEAPTAPSDAVTGTVSFASIPDGADIYVDGEFMGNSPATLKVKLGKHTITAKMSGCQDWNREITVSGGAVNLNAKLTAGSTPSVSDSGVTTGPEPARIVEEESGTGWIGVTTKDDSAKGVVITMVLAGSPADQARLQVGDVIEEMDGVAVKSGMRFDVAIAHSKPGSQIRLGYIRGAWKSEATLTVGKIG